MISIRFAAAACVLTAVNALGAEPSARGAGENRHGAGVSFHRWQRARGQHVERAVRRPERKAVHRAVYPRGSGPLLRIRPGDAEDASRGRSDGVQGRTRTGHPHQRQDPCPHGRGRGRTDLLRRLLRGHRTGVGRSGQLPRSALVPLRPATAATGDPRPDQSPVGSARVRAGAEVPATVRLGGGRPSVHFRSAPQDHHRPRPRGRLGHLPHDLLRRRRQCVRLVRHRPHLEIRPAAGPAVGFDLAAAAAGSTLAAAHDVQSDDRPQGLLARDRVGSGGPRGLRDHGRRLDVVSLRPGRRPGGHA